MPESSFAPSFTVAPALVAPSAAPLVRRTYAGGVDTDIPGWHLRCLQTTAGLLTGGSHELHLPGVQLLHERYRHVATSHSGIGPGDAVMFAIPTGMQDDGRFNGRDWTRGSLCVLSTDCAFEVITPPTDLLCVVVQRDLLVQHIRAVEQEDVADRLQGQAFVAGQPADAARLAERLSVLVREGFALGEGGLTASLQHTLTQEIVAWLSPLLVQRWLSPGSTERHAQVHVAHVRRARAYAMAHIDQPLRVEDLCRALSLSRRALQASFQAVLGLSPQQFLRTLRLNGARRSLQAGQSVREAVETWGFWHWSRFSAEYRALFGELPSQTRTM